MYRNVKLKKTIRHWDIGYIRHNGDALMVKIGDILEYKEIWFEVTFCGDTKVQVDPLYGFVTDAGHRAWCGRMHGAKERWGIADNTVVAWGPNGIAKSFPQYEAGELFEIGGNVTSYLWLGETK